MIKNYHIIDTTLREGEQTPGLLFSLTEKKRILDGLARIGITETELGISSKLHPCPGPLISYCRANHPALKLSLWSRCRQEDISHASRLNPDILSLSIPVSDIHLRDRLQKDRLWAQKTMETSIDFARQKGLTVSIGFEDATRSDPDFLLKMAKAAAQHGAVRIRLADTVGIASPSQFTGLVTSLTKSLSGCLVAVHTHNDFGMATANAVAALEAGASSVDAVVLGLGERTGCARLEEIVGYLSLARGVSELKPEFLKPLARYVAEISGKNIAGNRPIIGDDIFTCETGLHLQGLQSKPQTYEPFCPEKVQAERRLLFGSKSGRRAILQRMTQLNNSANSDFSEELTDEAVQAIREAATKLRRPLSDTELISLLATFIGPAAIGKTHSGSIGIF
jgi:homocitrate synthase NifV